MINTILFSVSEIANRLSNSTDSNRAYKKVENFKNKHNSSMNIRPVSSTMKSVNLLRIKELKLDNLSTMSMDHFFLSSNPIDSFMLTFFLLFRSNIVSVSSDNSNEALNADTTRTNALRRILLAFSWRRNFAILFSELPKNCISDVIEIAGLRVLCLLWILLVHICTVLYYVAGKINYITIIIIFHVHYEINQL